MTLTDAQRRHLERRLIEERDRIVRALQEYGRRAASESERDADGDLSLAPLHMADEGTDTMQQELEAANAARETSELEQIDAALQRLYREPERFGVDERTGEPIPFERLDVIPWARTAEHSRRR